MILSIVSFVSFFLFCGRKEKETLVSKHIGIRTYILHEKFAGRDEPRRTNGGCFSTYLHLSPATSSGSSPTYHKTLNTRILSV